MAWFIALHPANSVAADWTEMDMGGSASQYLRAAWIPKLGLLTSVGAYDNDDANLSAKTVRGLACIGKSARTSHSSQRMTGDSILILLGQKTAELHTAHNKRLTSVGRFHFIVLRLHRLP